MGKRGPAPLPTAILRLTTPWRALRRDQEPKVEIEAPECPDWIPDLAKQAWNDLVPQLLSMGVLSRIDANALTRYCVLWARWREAEQFLKKHGDTYPLKTRLKKRDEKGNVYYVTETIGFRPYPKADIVHQLATQLYRLETEFGLTPSARTRIRVEDQKTADPLGDFVAGKHEPPAEEAVSG